MHVYHSVDTTSNSRQGSRNLNLKHSRWDQHARGFRADHFTHLVGLSQRRRKIREPRGENGKSPGRCKASGAEATRQDPTGTSSAEIIWGRARLARDKTVGERFRRAAGVSALALHGDGSRGIVADAEKTLDTGSAQHVRSAGLWSPSQRQFVTELVISNIKFSQTAA